MHTSSHVIVKVHLNNEIRRVKVSPSRINTLPSLLELVLSLSKLSPCGDPPRIFILGDSSPTELVSETQLNQAIQTALASKTKMLRLRLEGNTRRKREEEQLLQATASSSYPPAELIGFFPISQGRRSMRPSSSLSSSSSPSSRSISPNEGAQGEVKREAKTDRGEAINQPDEYLKPNLPERDPRSTEKKEMEKKKSNKACRHCSSLLPMPEGHFKCSICPDFRLCERCNALPNTKINHDLCHTMIKVTVATQCGNQEAPPLREKKEAKKRRNSMELKRWPGSCSICSSFLLPGEITFYCLHCRSFAACRKCALSKEERTMKVIKEDHLDMLLSLPTKLEVTEGEGISNEASSVEGEASATRSSSPTFEDAPTTSCTTTTATTTTTTATTTNPPQQAPLPTTTTTTAYKHIPGTKPLIQSHLHRFPRHTRPVSRCFPSSSSSASSSFPSLCTPSSNKSTYKRTTTTANTSSSNNNSAPVCKKTRPPRSRCTFGKKKTTKLQCFSTLPGTRPLIKQGGEATNE